MRLLKGPVTTLPSMIVTRLMLFRSSSARYCEYGTGLAASDFWPDSWMRTTGMRRIRIQNERVFEKRPQLNSFFLGGIGRGITASSRYTGCAENSRRDLNHTPQGTRWVHQTQ